ncbi:MAG: cation-translocating P-type ATPase [Candidatus Wallbacteria bacterium]|nr:cation-translocating P-type ATPase [Candidatus Wallbacteria bacterium]
MHTRHLDIGLLFAEGVDCERCLERVEQSLLGVRGIVEASVDRPRAQLRLVFDPDVTGMDAVERSARDVGVELARRFRHDALTLTGLDCMDCATKLEDGVGQLDGVVWCSVSFATSQMRVEYETGRAGPEQILGRIRELGYDAITEGESADTVQSHRLASTVASGALLAAAAVLPLPPGAANALCGAAIVAGGWLFFRNGLAGLRLKAIDTNLLMGLAALGAAALGHLHEGGMVVFLYGLGNILEGLALQKNRHALRELIGLVPHEALRLQRDPARLDSEPTFEVRVDLHELAPGDVVRLRPWDRVPVDLRILRGQSHVDQSSLTGESGSIPKGPGDELLSGSLNGEGMLEAEVVRPHGRDTLSQVLEMVRVAQSRKAPSQTFSERFGRIYSPVVLAAAALLTIAGLFAAGNRAAWFLRALTLLVVACPCALVIATPVAIASALAGAARMGVIVKGGVHLEVLGQCRAIAFDKTGTLTTGQFSVTELASLPGHEPREVLVAAGLAAAGSDHPVARALAEYARDHGVPATAPQQVSAVAGAGLEAQHEGRSYALGRASFLAERGYSIEEFKDEFTRISKGGGAVVGIGCEGRLLGLAAMSDRLREQAFEAVTQLRRLALNPVVMLTGDLELAARSMAEKVGIRDVRAGLLPAGKLRAIEELTGQHGPVAMVGDGVNDAPAMAQAAVGIALGAAGNAVATETADIVVMGTDLRSIPRVVELARRTARVIRQNMALSVGAVLAMIGLSLAGSLSLSGAVLFHEGSALAVIVNGLRLLAADGSLDRGPAPGEKVHRA